MDFKTFYDTYKPTEKHCEMFLENCMLTKNLPHEKFKMLVEYLDEKHLNNMYYILHVLLKKNKYQGRGYNTNSSDKIKNIFLLLEKSPHSDSEKQYIVYQLMLRDNPVGSEPDNLSDTLYMYRTLLMKYKLNAEQSDEILDHFMRKFEKGCREGFLNVRCTVAKFYRELFELLIRNGAKRGKGFYFYSREIDDHNLKYAIQYIQEVLK